MTHREELAARSARMHRNRHTGCLGYSKRDDAKRAAVVDDKRKRLGLEPFAGWPVERDAADTLFEPVRDLTVH